MIYYRYQVVFAQQNPPNISLGVKIGRIMTPKSFMQQLLNFWNTATLPLQLLDFINPCNCLFPWKSPRQILLFLFKGQHSLLCVVLQGAVPASSKPNQFPNGNIFWRCYLLKGALSWHFYALLLYLIATKTHTMDRNLSHNCIGDCFI